MQALWRPHVPLNLGINHGNSGRASQCWYNARMTSTFAAPRARIVFMGSPDFSLPTLRALANTYEVVGVVTQPDRASGRGRELKAPPVKTIALEMGIPLIQPEKLRQPEAMEQLRL